MSQFTSWIPFVQVDVPGCPRALMLDAIRQAVIEFCQDSMFWRLRMDPMTTQANVNQYELDTPSYTTIVSVRSLVYDGRALEERNVDDMDNHDPSWRTKQGTPYAYAFLDPNTVILSTTPTDTGIEFNATIALKPTQDSVWCDDSIFEEYRDAITAGACARLMLSANKAWSNPQLAAVKQGIFTEYTVKAKDRALRGLGRRVRPRVKANYF